MNPVASGHPAVSPAAARLAGAGRTADRPHQRPRRRIRGGRSAWPASALAWLIVVLAGVGIACSSSCAPTTRRRQHRPPPRTSPPRRHHSDVDSRRHDPGRAIPDFTIPDIVARPTLPDITLPDFTIPDHDPRLHHSGHHHPGAPDSGDAAEDLAVADSWFFGTSRVPTVGNGRQQRRHGGLPVRAGGGQLLRRAGRLVGTETGLLSNVQPGEHQHRTVRKCACRPRMTKIEIDDFLTRPSEDPTGAWPTSWPARHRLLLRRHRTVDLDVHQGRRQRPGGRRVATPAVR